MDNRVICVVGPTATGKTKMGVALAKRFGGEVVSVDSMQIYRGMTIGTAAPTAEEMDGVRHHMVAIADPAELRRLVDRVQSGEIQYCPHGRPVAVKLSKYQVEKMFKRA